MKINNVGEFYSFIMGNGLSYLAPELAALEVCMNEFSMLCACDSNEVKNDKLNQCSILYTNFVVNSARHHKPILLSKSNDSQIIFLNNGQQLLIIHY